MRARAAARRISAAVRWAILAVLAAAFAFPLYWLVTMAFKPPAEWNPSGRVVWLPEQPTLDNFRVLYGYGWPRFRRQRLFRQDKGHAAEMRHWVERTADGGPPLIPPDQLWEVAEVAIRASQTLTQPPDTLDRTLATCENRIMGPTLSSHPSGGQP